MNHLVLFYRILVFGIGFGVLLQALLAFRKYQGSKIISFIFFWANMSFIALGYILQYYLVHILDAIRLSGILNLPLMGAGLLIISIPVFSIGKGWTRPGKYLIALGILAGICFFFPLLPIVRNNARISDIIINTLSAATIVIFVVLPLVRRGKENKTKSALYYLVFIPIGVLFILKDFYHMPVLPESIRAFPLFYAVLGVIMMLSPPYKSERTLSSAFGNELPEEFVAEFKLTPREAEIALLLARGESYNGIAEKCFISQNTVLTHVKNIYRKTETRSKWELQNRILDKIT